MLENAAGGVLLLRQADRKIDLLRRVAGCFTDYTSNCGKIRS